MNIRIESLSGIELDLERRISLRPEDLFNIQDLNPELYHQPIHSEGAPIELNQQEVDALGAATGGFDYQALGAEPPAQIPKRQSDSTEFENEIRTALVQGEGAAGLDLSLNEIVQTTSDLQSAIANVADSAEWDFPETLRFKLSVTTGSFEGATLDVTMGNHFIHLASPLSDQASQALTKVLPALADALSNQTPSHFQIQVEGQTSLSGKR